MAGLDGAGNAGVGAWGNVSSVPEGSVTTGLRSSVTADGEGSVANTGEDTDEKSMAGLVPASLLGEAAPLLRCGGVYLPTPDVDDLTGRRSALALSESDEVE